VSTWTHVDYLVGCDYPGCIAVGTWDQMDIGSGGSAASVRRRLKADGWAVNLPPETPAYRQRRDFCPEHKRPSEVLKHDN
jgi:hypothetical protein